MPSRASEWLTGDEFAEWLDCIAPHGEAIGVLKATVDESGTHDDKALLCVAFCITTTTQWGKFEQEWTKVRVLPRGVNRYHAKDRRCDDLSERLAQLMRRRIERIVAVTIHEREYKGMASARFRSFAGDGYALAIQSGVYHIHRWLWELENQRVSYVIASGHKGQGAVDQFLTLVGNTEFLRRKLRFVSHTFLPNTEPIFDPPDLVSHELSSAGGRDTSRLLRLVGRPLEVHHLSVAELQEAQETVEIGFRNRRRNRQARKAGG